jgi:homoserine/homoserine lactone efflux protein
MTLQDWLLFVAFWTAASIPLGPNAMNCIVISMSDGFRRGLWAMTGIVMAAACHMAASILGLSAILLANASLFHAIKWLGVAYLAWLGVAMLLKKTDEVEIKSRPSTTPLAAIRRGFVTSITNPKAILVYVAVFPQFIRAEGALGAQLLILIPTALVIAMVVYTGYCAFGTGIARLLSTARRRLAFNFAAGGFYLFSAFGLSWLRQQRS